MLTDESREGGLHISNDIQPLVHIDTTDPDFDVPLVVSPLPLYYTYHMWDFSSGLQKCSYMPFRIMICNAYGCFLLKCLFWKCQHCIKFDYLHVTGTARVNFKIQFMENQGSATDIVQGDPLAMS